MTISLVDVVGICGRVTISLMPLGNRCYTYEHLLVLEEIVGLCGHVTVSLMPLGFVVV